MNVMRVLVASAGPVARVGLETILARQPDITVLTAQTRVEVETLVTNHHWDVVVLDANLSGRADPASPALLWEIKRQHPRLPVLVLSSDSEENFALRVLRGGAAGYVNKRATPKELVRAVRRLAEGRRYVNPAVAEELLGVLGNDSEWIVQRLSDREYQVLCLLGRGKSVRQAAYELRRSA